MWIIYVDHAEDRMRERNISKEDVQLTIDDPDSTKPSVKGRTIYTRAILGQQTPVRVVAKKKPLTIDNYIVYTVF